MKIKLYYDVLQVPPTSVLRKRRESGTSDLVPDHLRVKCFRFVKEISMPFLLVRGQIYDMDYDPITTEDHGSSLEVSMSGVFEKDGRQIPFMIIVDDYWLAFDNWQENECSSDERALPLKAQIELWCEERRRLVESLRSDFLEHNWKEFDTTCVNGRPRERGPELSVYQID